MTDRQAAAAYIAAMQGELKKQALRHGLATLAYLIGMAEEEATNEANDGRRKP